jgi:prevent-host-death family protein
LGLWCSPGSFREIDPQPVAALEIGPAHRSLSAFGSLLFVLCNGPVKVTEHTLTVSKAQAGLPKLCNSGKSFLITNRDKPTAVLLPIADYEALIETMDLLANPRAMKALHAARAGKSRYRDLDLTHENFGL